MKKILVTAWLTDFLMERVPFLRRKAPWYQRYGIPRSPWLPAALIAPLALFVLYKVAQRFLAASSEHAGTGDSY